jgi:methionyl-tRNA formyltransferase
VHEAGFHNSTVSTDNGRILNIDSKGVWISCDGGYIICKKIILQSDRKEVAYSFFKIGQMASGQEKVQ